MGIYRRTRSLSIIRIQEGFVVVALTLLAWKGLGQGALYWSSHYFLAVVGLFAVIPAGKKFDKAAVGYIFCYICGIMIIIITAILAGSLHWPIRRIAVMLPIMVFLVCLAISRHRFVLARSTLLGIVCGGLSIGIYLLVFEFFAGGFPASTRAGISFDEIGIGKNGAGIHLAIAIAATIVLVRARLVRWKYGSIVAIFLYVAVLVTWSTRALTVATLCMLMLIFGLAIDWRKKCAMVVGLILCGLIFSNVPELAFAGGVFKAKMLGIFGIEFDAGVASSSYGVAAADYRKFLAKSGMEIFSENPWTGIGLENTRLLLGTYTHVDLVELLAGTGVFGASAFYSGYVIVSWAVMKRGYSWLNAATNLILVVALLLLGLAGRLYDGAYLHSIFVAFIVIQGHIMLLDKKNPHTRACGTI